MKDLVLETIQSRRSIRRYTGAPVSQELLTELVRAGMAAPTSRDSRHLRFIMVDDAAVIIRLMEGLPYAKMLATAKHAIIVLSDIAVAYGGLELDYWVQDSAAAAQNILLAAHALGLGACWTGVHPRPEREKFVRELFLVPETVMPLCVIAVGVPTGEDKPRDKFNPSHVSRNHWGSH